MNNEARSCERPTTTRHNRDVRAANLAVKFLLELAAFAGLGYWGWHVGQPSTPAALALAVATPAAAIAIWGLFAAPRSKRRLPAIWRIPLELAVFLLAAVAVGATGHVVLAAVFAVVVVVNAIGLTVFRQWDA